MTSWTLAANFGSFDSLNVRTRCGLRPCAAQMRCTLRWLTPAAFAIARQVQCVVSPGGSLSVISTTRSTAAGVSGGLPPGRVASCSSPSTPSAINRACQRQIVGLPLPVCRWIAIVPIPPALSRTIRARHTCFCGLFPDPITASSRSRSPGPSWTSTPFLIQPDSHIREPAGIIRQRRSTSALRVVGFRSAKDRALSKPSGRGLSRSHNPLSPAIPTGSYRFAYTRRQLSSNPNQIHKQRALTDSLLEQPCRYQCRDQVQSNRLGIAAKFLLELPYDPPTTEVLLPVRPGRRIHAWDENREDAAKPTNEAVVCFHRVEFAEATLSGGGCIHGIQERCQNCPSHRCGPCPILEYYDVSNHLAAELQPIDKEHSKSPSLDNLS